MQQSGCRETRFRRAQTVEFEINGFDPDRGALFVDRIGVFTIAAAIFRHGVHRAGPAIAGGRFKTNPPPDPASAMAVLST